MSLQAMRDVRRVIGDADLPFSLASVDLLVIDHFAEPGRTQLTDPWDRLIVATAASQGLRLITRDERITESRLVETIW